MMRALRRQFRAWKQEFLALWGRLRSFHRVALGITLAAVLAMVANRYVFASLKVEIREKRETLEKKEAPEVVPTPDADPESQELRLRIENLEETMASHRKKKQEAIAAWPDFGAASKGVVLAKFNDMITQAGLDRLEYRDAAVDLLAPPVQDPRRAGRDAKAPAASRRQSPSEKARAEKEQAKEKAKEQEKGKTAKKSDKSADKAKAEKPKKKDALETAVHSYLLSGSFQAVQGFLKAIDAFAYPARLENLRLQLAEEELGAVPQGHKAPQIRLSFQLKLYSHD